MVIPKQFDGIQDLEAMLLTSVLGTLIALKDSLISIQQAENYWLSDFTADMFKELNLSDEVIQLLQDGAKLRDYQPFPQIYEDNLNRLIDVCKDLIGKYYTEYNETSIQIKSVVN